MLSLYLSRTGSFNVKPLKINYFPTRDKDQNKHGIYLNKRDDRNWDGFRSLII